VVSCAVRKRFAGNVAEGRHPGSDVNRPQRATRRPGGHDAGSLRRPISTGSKARATVIWWSAANVPGNLIPRQAIDIETATGDTVAVKKSFPKTGKKSACICYSKPEARKKRPWPSVFCESLRRAGRHRRRFGPSAHRKNASPNSGSGNRPTQGKVPGIGSTTISNYKPTRREK